MEKDAKGIYRAEKDEHTDWLFNAEYQHGTDPMNQRVKYWLFHRENWDYPCMIVTGASARDMDDRPSNCELLGIKEARQLVGVEQLKELRLSYIYGNPMTLPIDPKKLEKRSKTT